MLRSEFNLRCHSSGVTHLWLLLENVSFHLTGWLSSPRDLAHLAFLVDDGASLPRQHFYWAVSSAPEGSLKAAGSDSKRRWQDHTWCPQKWKLENQEELRCAQQLEEGRGLQGKGGWGASGLTKTPHQDYVVASFLFPLYQDVYIKALVAERTFFSSPPTSDLPWARPWMPATRCSPLVAAWYLMYSLSDWCRLSIVFPRPSDSVPANWNKLKPKRSFKASALFFY